MLWPSEYHAEKSLSLVKRLASLWAPEPQMMERS